MSTQTRPFFLKKTNFYYFSASSPVSFQYFTTGMLLKLVF